MLRPLGLLEVVLALRAKDLVILPYASFASVRLSCVASDLDMEVVHNLDKGYANRKRREFEGLW